MKKRGTRNAERKLNGRKHHSPLTIETKASEFSHG